MLPNGKSKPSISVNSGIKRKAVKKVEEKPTFEEQIEVITEQTNRRRASWTLSSLPFEDVRQMVLVRVWEQYDKFDPVKGSFLHWVNRVISNAIINILRDNYMKFQRPCISGCIHNMGEDDCSQTPSGKQCEECPIYKEWKKRKISHYNVKQTLPLNTHLREAESKVDSSIDFNHYKTLIDKMMRKKMNHHEYSLYKKIFIEGRDEKEVGEEIGYVKSGHTYAGYQMIRKMKQKARDLAKQFLEDENLS